MVAPAFPLFRAIMFSMEWAQKRKILYAISFAVAIILLAAYPVYNLVKQTPTCSDKKQNGTETGVDCGGSCSLVCSADVKPLRVVWSKVFSVNGGYDIAAYVENVNTNAGLKNVRYTMSVLDNSGRILIEKKGSLEVSPASRFLLFETGVTLSGAPDRIDVSFDPEDLAKWLKATTEPSPVVTKNQILINADTKPRFNAVIVNTDPVNEVANLTLSAIVYDPLRHPIAVSKTYTDRIEKNGEQNIFFTWPTRFTKNSLGGICMTPVDTMLVFDRSGSMDVGHKIPAEPLETAKVAAKAYVDLVDIADRVGFVSFANTASFPIDHILSSDSNSVGETLLATVINKDGIQNTNLGDALRVAIEELQSTRHSALAKKVIIALTDGDANRPLDPKNKNNTLYAEEYAAKFASDARKSGIEVYVVGLGTKINEAFLRNRIGGDVAHYFNAPTPEKLQGIYKTISEAVCPVENFITEIIVTPRAIFTE